MRHSVVLKLKTVRNWSLYHLLVYYRKHIVREAPYYRVPRCRRPIIRIQVNAVQVRKMIRLYLQSRPKHQQRFPYANSTEHAVSLKGSNKTTTMSPRLRLTSQYIEFFYS